MNNENQARKTLGVTGKILWVDLSSGTWHEEQVPEEVYSNFLAGMGLAAYYLYQRIPAGVDPLGPENILAFVPGLLTCTGSMLTGRWMAAAKSPLTQTWGDANCGGTLAPAIKQCGYDGIFFTGISPQPVYLYIGHGKVELRDASALWGKDTRETEDLIRGDAQGKTISIACIGPAGEKLSLISGISNDQGRMAARSGLGAVMGSKKLKAIALQGVYTTRIANEREMKRLSEKFARLAAFQPPFLNGVGASLLGTFMRIIPLQMRQDGILYKFFLAKYGTSGLNQYSMESGDSPIRNWAGSNRDLPPSRSKSVDPDRIKEREKVKYHCYSCPVGCGGITFYDQEKAETHKPEYETILAFGGLVMNDDLESIFVINEKLNRAGMDSISAGGSVAYAIEAYQNGVIGKEETGGLDLTWGNTAVILELVDQMIERRGFGDLIADGSKVAARHFGRDSIKFAVQAGGQELAMHDGRNDPGFALHAVVEPTPGRHTIGSYLYYEMYQLWTRVKGLPRVKYLFYPKKTKYTANEEKAIWASACSQFTSLLNGAGGCIFGAFLGVNRYPIFEWLNAATGWNRSPEEYMRIGWNIQTVRQAFNTREGIRGPHAINDRPVGRVPLTEGANKGASVPLDELTRLYYQAIGWDPKSAAPPSEAVTRLGLSADGLEG
jgi:aldehyde:ferredoxin oxidoreductase